MDKEEENFVRFQLFNGHSLNLILMYHLFELSSEDCVLKYLKQELPSNEHCLEFPDYTANFILEIFKEENELRI